MSASESDCQLKQSDSYITRTDWSTSALDELNWPSGLTPTSPRPRAVFTADEGDGALFAAGAHDDSGPGRSPLSLIHPLFSRSGFKEKEEGEEIRGKRRRRIRLTGGVCPDPKPIGLRIEMNKQSSKSFGEKLGTALPPPLPNGGLGMWRLTWSFSRSAPPPTATKTPLRRSCSRHLPRGRSSSSRASAREATLRRRVPQAKAGLVAESENI